MAWFVDESQILTCSTGQVKFSLPAASGFPNVAAVKIITRRPPSSVTLEVTLQLTNPPVWRRLRVRDDLPLDFLHCAIQIAMGWQHCHLHQFFAGREVFCDRDINGPSESLNGPEEVEERRVSISELTCVPGLCFLYEYDFGDSWFHEIRFEERSFLQETDHEPLAFCLDGARSGPPEDCGGPYGFSELLTAMKKGRGAKYTEIVRWLGRAFNPDSFDLALTNECLARLTRKHTSAPQLAKILRYRDERLGETGRRWSG